MRARDNPFATDKVLRVRYRLCAESWQDMLKRLALMNYRAAIIGPKGAGKTTFLEDLAVRLKEIGFVTECLRLDADHPRLAALPEIHENQIILLDGAEQMSRWAWWRFKMHCRHARGLIITSHQAGLLAVLLECHPTPEVLDAILVELLGQKAAEVRAEAMELFASHDGNMREVLRSLYDRFADLPCQ